MFLRVEFNFHHLLHNLLWLMKKFPSPPFFGPPHCRCQWCKAGKVTKFDYITITISEVKLHFNYIRILTNTYRQTPCYVTKQHTMDVWWKAKNTSNNKKRAYHEKYFVKQSFFAQTLRDIFIMWNPFFITTQYNAWLKYVYLIVIIYPWRISHSLGLIILLITTKPSFKLANNNTVTCHTLIVTTLNGISLFKTF